MAYRIGRTLAHVVGITLLVCATPLRGQSATAVSVAAPLDSLRERLLARIGQVPGATVGIWYRDLGATGRLLGINAGAAFLVVLSIYLFGMTTPSQYLWFAFAGALLAAVTVFGFASIGGGKASPLSLALAGAAVAFFLQ